MHLPTLLFLFLSRWGHVHDVKLSHAVADSSRCAFAEFTSEEGAISALHGTKFIPFMGTYLRLEPARAERTLRFSLINPMKPCVQMDPMWLQQYALSQLRPISLACHQAHVVRPIFIPFNEQLARNLAEPYGPIEMIRTRAFSHCHVVDVIFEHRDSASQGQAALALLPPKGNLRVRWYGAMAMQTDQGSSCVDTVIDPRFTYVHRSLPHVNYEGPVLVPTFYQKVTDTATKKADATRRQMQKPTSSPRSRAKCREATVACVQLLTDDRSKTKNGIHGADAVQPNVLGPDPYPYSTR